MGIQHPHAPQPLAALALYDGEAVCTSGDYQRYFELNGRCYSHLIDPRSGAPATGTQAVTVLITPQAGAGVLSDVVSNPVFISADDWPAMARRYGVSHAMRIDEGGRVTVTQALFARMKLLGDTEVTVIDD